MDKVFAKNPNAIFFVMVVLQFCRSYLSCVFGPLMEIHRTKLIALDNLSQPSLPVDSHLLESSTTGKWLLSSLKDINMSSKPAQLWRPMSGLCQALRWMSNPSIQMMSGAPFTNMVQFQSQHGYIITCLVKCGMKLLIHFQTSMMQSNFIPHFIMDVITYPCWD